MNENFILSQLLLKHIRSQVRKMAGVSSLNKNHDGLGIALDLHLKQISNVDSDETWRKRIATLEKKRKKLTPTHNAYQTFCSLCDFLQVGIHKSGDVYQIGFLELLEALQAGGVITAQQKAAAQMESGLVVPQHQTFTGYYSRGREQPGTVILTIKPKDHVLELVMKNEPKNTYSGHYESIHGSLWAKLSCPHQDRLLTLQMTASLLDPEAAAGIVYGILTIDLQSARLMAIPPKLWEKEPDKWPAMAQRLLYRQTVDGQTENTGIRELKELAATYEGYWFAVRENIRIICFTLLIRENGSCRITGPDAEIINGHISSLDNDLNMMRCEFSYATEVWQNSLQLVFDLSKNKADYFDGLYQGLEPHHKTHLMAGRIRIYPTDHPAAPAIMTRARLKLLQPAKYDALMNLFWGDPRNVPSSRFMQPNKWTFENLSNERETSTNERAVGLSEFDGTHLLYKRDSRERKINCYPVFMERGQVTYSLKLGTGFTRRYKAEAEIQANCLMIKVNERDGKPYEALYIFEVGQRLSSATPFLTGVYATTSHGGTPVCGRVVMEHHSNTNTSISSKEKMLHLLSGLDDNLIQAGKSEDGLHLRAEYGSLFFRLACLSDPGSTEQLTMLKLAFDDGFNNYHELVKAVAGPLQGHFQMQRIKYSPVENRPGAHHVQLRVSGDQEDYVFLE